MIVSIKKLHRIYFGFDGKPDPYRGYLSTWSAQLPDYEIFHWNASNLPLDQCFFSKMMHELKDHAFLSDYFRWWILREHGGIYLDADIEIVRGELFNKLIEDLEASPDIHALIGIDNKAGGWYTGHSMACKKGSQLAQFMCDAYEGLGPISLWRRKIFYFMAPQMTALYFATKGWNVDGMGGSPNLEDPVVRAGVKIYPQEYFSPMTPRIENGIGGFVIDGFTDNTCLCHHFSCSWHDETSPYKRAAESSQQNVLLNELIAAPGDNDINKAKYLLTRTIRIYKAVRNLLRKAPKAILAAVKNS